MKALFILSLLFASFTGYGQNTPAAGEPFKKANTIMVTTSLAPEEVFKLWGRHLGQNGYTIDKSDPTFWTITTGKKATSKMNYSFVVNSAVNDKGELQLRFKWALNSSMLAGTRESALYDWEYATSRANVQNIIYNDFIQVVKSFGDYPVSYTIK